jgi:hypothetical protein
LDKNVAVAVFTKKGLNWRRPSSLFILLLLLPSRGADHAAASAAVVLQLLDLHYLPYISVEARTVERVPGKKVGTQVFGRQVQVSNKSE